MPHNPGRTLSLVALLLALGWGLPLVAGDDQGYKPSADSKREEVVQKLNNMKITLDFKDTPLEDVIDFLREMTGLNFVIDKKVYDKHGKDELLITIRLDNLQLRAALKLTLGMADLTAKYKEGVLIIVPKGEEGDDFVMRMYDVRDLLMQIQDFPGPEISLQAPGEGEGGVSGGAFGEDQSGANTVTDPDFVVELIKKNTGGGSWESNPKASVTINNGLLVVVQSPAVHKEIEKLIGMLRECK